ncbi:helix-turn-helix domain-containing protein [Enterococcus casseliflavus]|uniref:helix-turn-helix domain-containing protein n=1 Tax=Enterococcus casseliflavus TaxID=37734 RepID=UPI002DB62B9B|nr:helix-turn-helix domain-containing protein [Enterococcus casseliflavus]MEB8401535.1 helix-turn-helix domain-containing protein [Enterococcus casseliflavus]
MENLQLKFITNKVTIRWLKILDMLERSRVCSSKQIADSLKIGIRTISTDIREMREHFGSSVEISSEYVGYFFKEINPDLYHMRKRELIKGEVLFIVLKSILNGNLHTFEEWAFKFHLSESTMKRYLMSAEETLQEYELKFALTPVDLLGEEANIRKFFKDFYYEVEIVPHTLLPIDQMRKFIEQYTNLNQFKFNTNISQSDFSYYLYIMIQRIKSKRHLKTNKPMNVFVYSEHEKNFFNALDTYVYSEEGVIIPQEEKKILYLYCACQRTINDIEREKDFCNQFDKEMSLKKVSYSFLSIYDEKLYLMNPDLSYYVHSFFTAIQNLDNIHPIFNRNVTGINEFSNSAYPEGMKIAYQFIKKNCAVLNVSTKFIDDIVANLVLTVESIKDLHKPNPKKIAFLIEGSYYLSRSIESKAYRYLGAHHQIYFINMNKLNKKFLSENKIDIFVTNQGDYITEFLANVEYLVFKSLPDISDWNNLLKMINPQLGKDLRLGKVVYEK